MLKNIVWIKIETKKYYNLILKLNNIGISILEIKKNENFILIKTFYDDYKRIKKYLITYKVSIYSNTGISKILKYFKKYQIFTISVITGMLLLFIANNMIFKIDIKTNNKEIKSLVVEELEKYGLKKMRLKKSHKDIEVIVNKILNNNKDTLKWLEIKYDGLIMIVNLTETVNANLNNEKNNCNIIAIKDAKITSMKVNRGTVLKEINDYVIKGDIILSGSIIHNDEIKNTVCAGGDIYGEVWYKVKVEVPFLEITKEYTDKNRYNFNIKINDNTYKIFKNRLKVFDEKLTNLYRLNDFEINLIKEKEYVLKTKKLSEEEAYKKGIDSVIEKVEIMLEDDEEILLKKVLKKDVNNSKIYLEIFVVTKENIGKLQIVEENNYDNRTTT